MRQRIGMAVAAAMVLAGAPHVGCGASVMPRASAPKLSTGQAKCKVAASQQSPLVTEWAASEKANLEARLREGGVAVAYSGCTMRLLSQCKVPGSYKWQRTTPSTDMMEINSEDDLYAKLPLGAVSLEGELRSSGRLAVQTTVSGQLNLAGGTPDVPATPECKGVTHVVGALSVGAFKLKSGGDLNASASAGVGGIGANGKTSSSELVLRQAGDPDRCADATASDPNPACASPIQIFLWPLRSGAAPVDGPPGTVKVDFMAGDGESAWEVLSSDQVLCTTPCSKWLHPSTAVFMRVKPKGFFDSLSKRGTIDVPSFREQAADGPVEVRAYTTSMGKFASGLTLTSLAGIAAAAGIVLTSVGCAGDNPGLCKAGLITLPIGAVALVPGIWLTVAAGARAEVVPSEPPSLGRIFNPASPLRASGSASMTGDF